MKKGGSVGQRCWTWAGVKDRYGYGAIWHSGKQWKAHRYMWFREHGPIPDGLCVLHHCDNRACLNPAHLFLGTQEDNAADHHRKGRDARGERNGSAKLRATEALEIRELCNAGMPYLAIARAYGVQHRTVSLIDIGELWKL